MNNGLRFLAALGCLVSAGCSSPDLNPAAPRANTGYVDFYTDSGLGLSWVVKRASEKSGEMRKVFSEFTPLTGNILRLAAPEGTNRFEVWISNKVTTGPQPVLVQVANAKVTPVHVTLTSAGATGVENKSYEYRPTPMATRRVTRLATGEQQTWQIRLVAGIPQDYQPKERMPYSSPPSE